jgi:hypothetical protein
MGENYARGGKVGKKTVKKWVLREITGENEEKGEWDGKGLERRKIHEKEW